MTRWLWSLAVGVGACAVGLAQEWPQTAPVRVVGTEAYRYGSVAMGGSKYVTGIVWPARQPGHLFIRADGGGIWKLDRQSDSWMSLTDSLPYRWRDLVTIDTLAVHPDNPDILFMAGGGRWGELHDLLKTEDGGKSWRRLNVTNAAGRQVTSDGNGENKQAGERLVIDINAPEVMFFGTRNDGLLRSTDGGETWSAVQSFPLRGKAWAGLNFVVGDFAAGQMGEPTRRWVVGVTPDRARQARGGVYISEDAGATWSRVEDGPAVDHWGNVPMRARIARDGSIYLTVTGGVWKLPAGRKAWQNITPSNAKGRAFCGVNIHPADPQKLLVAETGGQSDGTFYYSADGGRNWLRYQHFQKDPAKSNVTLEAQAAWERADGPAGWGANASDVAFDPIHPAWVWHTSMSGVYRVEGVGQSRVTASLVGAGREQMTCAEVISPTTGAPLISGVWDVGGFRHEDVDTVPSSRIGRRERDGSWHRDPGKRAYQDIFDMDVQPNNPDDIVLAGGWQWNQTGEAAYSVDNGATFREFATKPFDGARFGRVAIGLDPDNVLWAPAGQAASPVFFTRENGRIWRQAEGAPLGLIATEGAWSFYRCIAADRVRLDRFYVYDRRDGKFFQSSDGGARFEHVATLPKQQGVHADWHRLEAAPWREQEVWLGLREQGLLKSTDGGKTWVRLGGIEWCQNFAFGKPRNDGDYPAVYLFGQIGGEKPTSTTVDCRLYRSDDGGETWVQINDETMQFATIGPGFAGDMQTHGRVYIGTTARGIFHGEPAGTGD